MNQYQKIVATGFLYQDGKFFAAKRSESEKFLPGFWELVGGKVAFGEELTDALVREFKEETCLDVVVGQPYWSFSYITDEGNRHTVEIVFVVSLEPQDQKVALDSSHSECKWVEKAELENMLFSDEAKESARRGFAQVEEALKKAL